MRYDRAEDAVWLLQQAFDHWPDNSSETAEDEALTVSPELRETDLAPGHYRQNPAIKIVQVDNQSFLADRQGASIHHLDSVGSAIWTLLAEPLTQEGISEVLLTAFPDLDAGQVQQDVANLVGELTRKNLLQYGSD